MTERPIKEDPEPSEWKIKNIPNKRKIPEARTKSGMFHKSYEIQNELDFPIQNKDYHNVYKRNGIWEEEECKDENCLYDCKKIDQITNKVTNDHFDEIKKQIEKRHPDINIELLKILNGPEKEKQETLPAEVTNSSEKKKNFTFMIIPKLTECEVCQHEFEKNKINCKECPYYN